MAPFGMAIEQVVIALSIEGATKIPARRAKDARATAGIQTFFGMRRKRKDAKAEPGRTLLIVADKACSRQSPSLISVLVAHRSEPAPIHRSHHAPRFHTFPLRKRRKKGPRLRAFSLWS
jgi:hypothetical protein